MNNLEAWAITQGYDPLHDYAPDPTLPEGFLSPHFREAEFACNHCGEMHPDGVPQQLVDFLEIIRSNFGGAPVTVNSGYRCSVHNDNVGGAPSSLHLQAKAADIVVKGVAPSVVHSYCDHLIGDAGGVGCYNSFTHIDVRGYKARW